jgi:hypothetical protein
LSHLIRGARRLVLIVGVGTAVACVGGGSWAHARPSVESAYNFGSVQAGSASYIAVMVGSSETPTTVDSVELSDADSPFWIEGEDCTDDDMGVNDVCYIGIVFQAPDADADFQDTLSVHAADGTSATATVQATAYRAGGLTPSVAQMEWSGGTLRQSVVLRNRTAESVWIDSVVASPPFSVAGTPGCSEELYPGHSCSIGVRPDAGAGDVSGALTVRYAGVQSWAGDVYPAPPYSTLSIPLVNRPFIRAPRRPSLPVPRLRPRPDYGAVEISLGNLADAIPQLVRGGPAKSRATPEFQAPAAGRLTLALFGWERARRLRIGGGTRDFVGASSESVRFSLNKRGRMLLRRPQRTRIKVIAKFEPLGSTVVFRQAPEYVVQRPKASKPKTKRPKVEESRAKKKRRPPGRHKR